jgi:hypothetical protein
MKASKGRTEITTIKNENTTKGENQKGDLKHLDTQVEHLQIAHDKMITNGDTNTDDAIQRLRKNVADNVHEVLEGEKAKSLAVQGDQKAAGDAAAAGQNAAKKNKALQSNVSAAVQAVMGNEHHAAIVVQFEEAEDFHKDIKDASDKDLNSLKSKTSETERVVTSKVQKMINLLNN